jgi:hypothetical protein
VESLVGTFERGIYAMELQGDDVPWHLGYLSGSNNLVNLDVRELPGSTEISFDLLLE